MIFVLVPWLLDEGILGAFIGVTGLFLGIVILV